MKVRSVTCDNRRKEFVIRLARRSLTYPYANVEPRPTPDNRVAHVEVDREIAREGFIYTLEAGDEGAVHVEQVLEYNRDPAFLRDALVYKLTLEARRRVETGRLPKREIIRRLGTSATQLYRLLDPANTRKSVDGLLALLQVLGCDVDLVVRPRSA